MQDRYAGDIGDYVKLALLRALSPGFRLGVAWYLYPDEGHNEDGKHIAYLSAPAKWRSVDANLFDLLHGIVRGQRSVAALELAGVLNATYANEPLTPVPNFAQRSGVRSAWFRRVLGALADCDLVFADPDNGLIDDNPKRRSSGKFGKQLPLQEALALAKGRSAIIYHHNTRFKGGHDLEVKHWRRLLGERTIAVRANAYSCRTFFIVKPSPVLTERAENFCRRWAHHNVRLDR